ncbi:MAG: hypothetical protein V1859_09105 [archaeon]
MNKKIIVFMIALLCVSYASAASIIIVNETEEQVYSLEQVIVSGDLEENTLYFSGYGEVISGEKVKVYLFGSASDFLIKDLTVNEKPTSLSFDLHGYYFLAEKGRFDVSGTIEVRTIGQMKLYARGPINDLKFELKNGYAISGDVSGVMNQAVILQRSEKVAMNVNGNFRFTYKDKNEFYYNIVFQAFGSSLGRYVLPLRNGETVTSVVGAVKWEQSGNSLVIDLGDKYASVTISGVFDSNNLKIPLDSDMHNVLIESDAEKKITITSSAKEIDLKESTIVPQYSNARAFLATGYDSFSITIKNLDLMPSLVASVRNANQRVAITEKGSVLGELTYSYANTGLDYIEIDSPGEPLYASTDGNAVKLTKDNKLLLSFPKTDYGNLDLIYFDTVPKFLAFNVIDVPLAQTDLVVTTQSTTIYLPEDYIVLETFGAKGGSELPDIKVILLFLVLVGGFAYLIKKDLRFVIAYLAFSLGVLVFDFTLFLVLLALTFIVKVRHAFVSGVWKWILIGAGSLIVVGIILFATFGAFSMMKSASMSNYGAYDSVQAEYAKVETGIASPMRNSLNTLGGDSDGSITVQRRKGVLPVKVELPTMGKTITVKNDLVTKENPVALKLLLIASWFKYLLYLVAIFAGVFCIKSYGSLHKEESNVQKKR